MRSMVGPYNKATIPPTATKSIMLAALEATELDLLQTIENIPTADRTSRLVCGKWTTQDVIAHLADWDLYFAAWLEQLCGGKENKLHFIKDEDRFNEWLQNHRQGQTWQRVWHDFRENRSVITSRLSNVSEFEFFLKKEAPFGTVYNCAWSALEHYLDHASGIKREMQMELPNQLLHFHGPYTG